MEIEGTLKLVMDKETFPSGFSKREFVITTADQYPQEIKLELLKEKTELIEPIKVGESLAVHFDIRGREHNGKYFNNLVAWKIERLAESNNYSPATGTAGTSPVIQPAASTGSAPADDLPF